MGGWMSDYVINVQWRSASIKNRARARQTPDLGLRPRAPPSGLTGRMGPGDNCGRHTGGIRDARGPAGPPRAGAGGEFTPVLIVENLGGLPDRARGAFLAVGNFDGVHRGHARLIARLRARADAAGVAALALTFDPHPAALLRPGVAPAPLAWTTRNAELLREAGATEVGVFRTGPWLLGLSAREFFDRVILGQFVARGLVEGPTFGFGRDRAGDPALLATWCAEAGLGLEIVPPTEVDGRIVSSTRIRAALGEGRVEEAATLLGRPHRLRGLISRGAGRGATIGFATANLNPIETLLPSDGVYAGSARIPDEVGPVAAAINIGPNPTFGEGARKVEVHLIDHPSGDLYGRTLEVDLLARLRPTCRFEGLDDLLAQIRRDVKSARAAFNAQAGAVPK